MTHTKGLGLLGMEERVSALGREVGDPFSAGKRDHSGDRTTVSRKRERAGCPNQFAFYWLTITT